MPCVARASTSLIILLFSELSSSSSLIRSRIGPTCRCTYFLLANGCVTRFTRFGSSPSQKSLGVWGGSGSRSLALCDVEVALTVELPCCANPGSASAETSMHTNIEFFIVNSLLWRVAQKPPLQPDRRLFDPLDCAPSGPNLQALHRLRPGFFSLNPLVCRNLHLDIPPAGRRIPALSQGDQVANLFQPRSGERNTAHGASRGSGLEK